MHKPLANRLMQFVINIIFNSSAMIITAHSFYAAPDAVAAAAAARKKKQNKLIIFFTHTHTYTFALIFPLLL